MIKPRFGLEPQKLIITDDHWLSMIFNVGECRIDILPKCIVLPATAAKVLTRESEKTWKRLERQANHGEPEHGVREGRDRIRIREDERMIKDDMRPCGARFVIDLLFCRRLMEIINMIRGSGLINQPWAAWQHPGFFSQRSCNGFLAKNTCVQHKPAGTLRHNTGNADQSSFWIKALGLRYYVIPLTWTVGLDWPLNSHFYKLFRT